MTVAIRVRSPDRQGLPVYRQERRPLTAPSRQESRQGSVAIVSRWLPATTDEIRPSAPRVDSDWFAIFSRPRKLEVHQAGRPGRTRRRRPPPIPTATRSRQEQHRTTHPQRRRDSGLAWDQPLAGPAGDARRVTAQRPGRAAHAQPALSAAGLARRPTGPRRTGPWPGHGPHRRLGAERAGAPYPPRELTSGGRPQPGCCPHLASRQTRPAGAGAGRLDSRPKERYGHPA